MQGVYEPFRVKKAAAAGSRNGPGLGDRSEERGRAERPVAKSVNLLTRDAAEALLRSNAELGSQGSLVISKKYSNGTKTTAGKTFLNIFKEIFSNSSRNGFTSTAFA